MLRTVVKKVRAVWRDARIPRLAREERRTDRRGNVDPDAGAAAIVRAALDWLRRAQDNSASHDGGVARDFSLVARWATSYPETTGYIVPTFLECADRLQDEDLRDRARRMLDWLCDIQFPEGGFQGGTIGATPRVPVTFNTGQILLGLAAGTQRFGDRYRPAMRSAAEWLATALDPDGCWRRHRTPFAKPSDKAYETHVSWGLFEAARVERNDAWIDAAVRQVDWAITRQQANGWVADNCLSDPLQPLTHTIGYWLRGVLEAHRFTGDARFLDAAEKCGRGALDALQPDGALAGRLSADWRPAVSWTCLTGSAQIAHCWLELYRLGGAAAYLDGARRTLSYVRRTVRRSGDPGLVGGVKGSFPVDGGYARFELPNWAAKFLIDACLLEQDIVGQRSL
jgi:hypothetical protein